MPSASSATDSFASVAAGLLLLLGEGAASGFVALSVSSLSLLESGAVDSLESSEVLSTSDSTVSDVDVLSSAVLGAVTALLGALSSAAACIPVTGSSAARVVVAMSER